MRLKDKVAVVTGAGDQFGGAIAIGYAREGATLFLQEFEDRVDRLEKIAAEARKSGGKVVTGIYDITKPGPMAEMTKAVMAEFGRIDVSVHATAGGWHGKVFECTEADWDRAVDRGLKAQFLASQAIGKEMARRGEGRIINMTSIVGDLGSGQAIPWCAAKGGTNAMTFAFAQALGPYGVRVAAICRGASDHTAYSGAATDERLRRLPLGRLGTQWDVVGPAVFLATEDAGWVTGSVLYADGGYVSAAATDDEYRPTENRYTGP